MIKNLLVVYMKSRYDIYKSHIAVNGQDLEAINKIPDKEHLKNIHAAHMQTLEKILKALKVNNIRYDLIYRADLVKGLFNLYDCVMAVGGDGTFLEAADYIKNDIPIVSVNSGVYYDKTLDMRRGSEGAYAAMDAFNLEEKLPLFLEGKLPVTHLERLAVEYNGELLDHLVLNEVSIGPDNPHRSMSYTIKTKDFEESQTSSGLIITAARAPWPLSYPGGSVLPLGEKSFQAVTRANYNSRYHLEKNMQKTDGIILKYPNSIEVESKDRTAAISLDGEHKQYSFGFGTKIKVCLSDKPLRVVGFDTEKNIKYYNVKREPLIRKIG